MTSAQSLEGATGNGSDTCHESNNRTDELWVVVVTGLSGAGKSTTLHALEDLGYFCIDNVPTTVVGDVLQACKKASVHRIALGIDVRVRAFFEHFSAALLAIEQEPNVHLRLLFLDANDRTLLTRFSTTRRPHPLSTSPEGQEREAIAVLDGITSERQRLAKVRVRATDIIDTTTLTVHELRRRVVDILGAGTDLGHMRIRVLSFGFKYGPPIDADVILDVRFLPNPYFVEELRQLTGLDAPVVSYVMQEADTIEFVEHAHDLLSFCMPRFEREGKAYFTLAIGCTGGRHRSVAVATHLAQKLREELGLDIKVMHRDVDRHGPTDVGREPDIIGGGVRGSGQVG